MTRHAAVGAALLLAAGCGGSGSAPTASTTPPPTVQTTAVLVGAGDVADCANDAGRHAEDTAKLLDKIDGTVFVAGDLAYPDGSAAQFAACYDPRWGRHKRRSRPAPGNHEYESPGAAPYFNYFGDLAGPFGDGFYSFTLGAWHVISMNSNVPATPGSPQYAWLGADLNTNRTRCTAVYWHHPTFTSGPSGGGVMVDVWRLLGQFGVDIVINGHDHFYERFVQQDADGRRDTTAGIREFVVGSGGAPLYPFVTLRPNSEVRVATYGVLKLTLRPEDYDWSFIEAGTEAVLDAGTALCH